MKSLVLYKYDTCPYCQRVMRYISTSGRKDVVYKDIHKDLMAERELVAVMFIISFLPGCLSAIELYQGFHTLVFHQ